jgi:electron transport complex protein RnfA
MIVSGIMALAFMGFTGVDSGLKKALAPDASAFAVVEEHPAADLVAARATTIPSVMAIKGP